LQALESKCHTGKTIFYDTVTVKGWAVDVRTHRIGELINKILIDPWPGTDEDPDEVEMTRTKWSWWGWGRKGTGKGKGGEDHGGDDDGWEKHGGVPKAQTDEDCIDCFKWCVCLPNLRPALTMNG